MSSTEFRLEGAEKLMRQLHHLGDRGSRRMVQAGLRAGLGSLRKTIRSQVPPHAKSVRRSIGTKLDLRRNIAKVGVNVGKKRNSKSFTPHAAVYVTGAKQRYTKTGAYRGRQRGVPVVVQGVAIGERQAEREMERKIEEKLLLELRRGV